jgi:CBS domain-containing protein
MKVRDILKTKGPEVFTIGEDKTLSDAITILVNNKIGVLLVLNSGAKLIGILSERDIIKEAHNKPESCWNSKVGNVMTKKVIVVEADDELDYVENVMTENRIRHLPVVQNKVLVGLISIGDIVKSQLSSTRYDNKYLMDYISGAVK